MKKSIHLSILPILLVLIAAGCLAPQVRLFSDATDPLREFTLSGEESEKVLIIPVEGVISDSARDEMFRTRPSMVQEIVSQLDLAREDKDIKAVILKINSPGGSVTASDILYHEILDYKNDTGNKVVVEMMGIATSGGYYVSLPADYIMAHPTTVTGSVGVIFIRPNVHGLLNKIGVDVNADVSGKNKDMGSPFRESTEQEKLLFNTLVGTLGNRFSSLVKKHRPVTETLEDISSARIFLAGEAKKVGLIDEIGYLADAIARAKLMAGLPEESRVVIYRRTDFPNDNIYNTVQMRSYPKPAALIDIGLPESVTHDLNGFYYLWTPGLGNN